MTSMRPCAIPDCDRPQRSRGWCKLHYARWRHHGHTDLEPADPLTPADYVALAAAVDQDARRLLPYAYRLLPIIAGQAAP
jgi:hypothetical protein